MDSHSIVSLISLLILLVLSGFFSSAETALTTVNRMRLRMLADDGNKKALLLLKITDNSGKMLSAILIGNNVVNLSASALTTIFVQNVFGNAFVSVATGILTFLVLIFGEIVPKTLATLYAEKIAFAYANIIYILITILTPFVFITENCSLLILKLFRIDPNAKNNQITEDELRTIVDVSHEEGVIESSEKKIIHNVFDLSDALAKDVMVPRIDVCAANLTTNLFELIDLIKKNKYTRIPIYDGTIDNIIGIINIKDLFFDDVLMNSNSCNSNEFDINKYIRETLFTFEQKNLYELFSEMRSASISLAIVLDDYGAVSGVISLEDILEELVGEIRDEYDFDEEDVIRKVDKEHYICSGQARIDEFNEFFGTDIASEDYESIGGVVIEHLDRLPNVGDTITINNFIIQVVGMDKKRIDRLIIRKK